MPLQRSYHSAAARRWQPVQPNHQLELAAAGEGPFAHLRNMSPEARQGFAAWQYQTVMMADPELFPEEDVMA